MSLPDDAIGFKPRFELSATFIGEQGGVLELKPAPAKSLSAEFAPFYKGDPGPQGIQGVKGDIGGTFEFPQNAPAAMWTVNHNLGFRPAVKALSVGGVEMMAEVIHANSNQVFIYFDDPKVGIATCS